MAAPSITSITFDKPGGYNPGDVITVTVAYVPGTAPQTFTLTINAVDGASGAQGTGTGTFSVAEPGQTLITASDTGSRTWTLQPAQSSPGKAVFTSTA